LDFDVPDTVAYNDARVWVTDNYGATITGIPAS
jgi:hypothetical protein